MWAQLGQHVLKSAQSRPRSAPVWPILTQFGRRLSKFADVGPNLTRLGLDLTDLCKVCFGHQIWAQIGPTPDSSGAAHSGRSLARQVLAISDEVGPIVERIGLHPHDLQGLHFRSLIEQGIGYARDEWKNTALLHDISLETPKLIDAQAPCNRFGPKFNRAQFLGLTPHPARPPHLDRELHQRCPRTRPEVVIAVVLWWLGSSWLVSTTSFQDLLLNAVALAFVTELDELIYKVLVPEDIKATVQSYAISRPQRASNPFAMNDEENG